MRSFLTSLFALIVSLFIGILIAQALAVWSNGSEEWLVAFGLAMLVAGAVTVVFFIEQLAFGTRKAAYVTALILTAIFALVAGILVWASITLSRSGRRGAGRSADRGHRAAGPRHHPDTMADRPLARTAIGRNSRSAALRSRRSIELRAGR